MATPESGHVTDLPPAVLELFDFIGNAFDHAGRGPYEEALARLASLAGADRAYLLRADRALSDLRADAGLAATSPPGFDLAAHAHAFERVVSRGGATALDAASAGEEAALLASLGCERAVAVPVFVDAESACVLVVCGTPPQGPVDAGLAALVEGAAVRLGGVLRRLRRYRDLLDTVDLERVERSIAEAVRSSLDPRDVAQTAASELAAFCAACGAIVVFAEGGRPVRAAERGIEGEGVADASEDDLARLVLWRYLSAGRVLAVDDVAVDPRAAAGREAFGRRGIRSVLAAPLLEGPDLIGAIAVLRAGEQRRWSPGEIALVEGVAAQTSIAVLQATLHQRLETALDRERTGNALKDEFLGTVSHELRTPLVAILGWAEMLTEPDSPPSADELRDGLAAIREASSTLHQGIEDLLDLSNLAGRKVSLDLTPLDANDAARAAVDILAPVAARKEIALSARTAPRPVIVDADPLRLEQLLWCLLTNALKFTPAGGRVTVKVAAELGGTEGGRATLAVEDTGEGIAAEFLPYVFDRFRQGDGSATRLHGGLGIGTAIAKSLAELHGGTLAVASDGRDAGARFTLSLPLSTRPATGRLTGDLLTEKGHALLRLMRHESGPGAPDAGAPRQGPAPEAEAARARRVLVVDVTRQISALVAGLLSRGAYRIVSVCSAEETVASAQRLAPDVILVDAGADMGWPVALLATLRASGVASPAVVLTDGRTTGQLAAARSAGFAGFIDKPIRRAELLEVLEGLEARP